MSSLLYNIIILNKICVKSKKLNINNKLFTMNGYVCILPI